MVESSRNLRIGPREWSYKIGHSTLSWDVTFERDRSKYKTGEGLDPGNLGGEQGPG